MKTIDEMRNIWRECFNDTPEYVEMYFNNVYRDEDAIYIEDNGRIVSSLLLQQYQMLFHGSIVKTGYIAGACTRRKARGQGLMTQLMHRALSESARRGNLFTFLIPAQSHLYYFYEKFGFSTSVFGKDERYTSLHSFAGGDGYTAVTPGPDRLYNAFSEMELTLPGSIIHSRRDFDNILLDNALDGGQYVAVALKENPDAIGAIAFAVTDDDTVVVKKILGTDGSARLAALARLRQLYPAMPFKVYAQAGATKAPVARGMARAVDVEAILSVIAASNPRWKCRIRVSDPILQFNTGSWRVGGGEVSPLLNVKAETLDYDVDISTFTSMLFSSRKIGDILNLPTVRPDLSLMLD